MPAAKKTETKTEQAHDPKLLNNVRFYEKFMTTPKDAQKSFKGKGGFEGTDINPMFRIKVLTEVFGPAGFGWWTDNVRYEFVESPTTKETHVFCELDLYIKDPESGEVSHPIYGIGGNTYIGTNKYGPTATDEAKKMAYTDALSIACKALGIGHDVWYGKDQTKYTMQNNMADDNKKAPVAAETATVEAHTEDTATVIDEIAKKLEEVGAAIDNETPDKDAAKQKKIAFAKETIAPIIGSMNYKSCTDITKLIALRDKLCA